jgi:hypothetical protein
MRAFDFAKPNGALLAPFGMAMPEAIDTIADAANALKLTVNLKYQQPAPAGWQPPFDTDWHYEAKAYHVMKLWLQCNPRVKGLTLFWSPMNGPAVN